MNMPVTQMKVAAVSWFPLRKPSTGSLQDMAKKFKSLFAERGDGDRGKTLCLHHFILRLSLLIWIAEAYFIFSPNVTSLDAQKITTFFFVRLLGRPGTLLYELTSLQDQSCSLPLGWSDHVSYLPVMAWRQLPLFLTSPKPAYHFLCCVAP